MNNVNRWTWVHIFLVSVSRRETAGYKGGVIMLAWQILPVFQISKIITYAALPAAAE